jgi:hypothetical protein
MRLARSIACAVAALLLAAPGWCQPSRSASLQTAEAYLNRVLAVNSGHAPVPRPTAAERAALIALGADVNEREELEIANWPATPLASIKSSGDVRALMGELRNTGSFRTKARENAREAERKEELAAMKERTNDLSSPFPVKPSVPADLFKRLQALGLALDERKFIVAGGKAFDPAHTDARILAQAAHKNSPEQLREIEALLAEMRARYAESPPQRR